MTKKKSKKKGEKAPRLPKRIAGVKVPKELREPGGKLLAAMRNPLVVDVAAAALIAAAAGLKSGRAETRSPASTGEPVKPTLGQDVAAILAATALEGVARLSGVGAQPDEGAARPARKGGTRKRGQV